MNFVNTKKSENGSPFLLIWVIFVVIFAVVEIISGDFEIDLSLFIFIGLIFLPPALYFFDIFLWQNIGKEIIYTQNEKLIVKKINRVFPRKKQIQFKKIEDIYLWQAKGFVKETFSSMSAFWDWNKQGTICIKYDTGCEYYIGRNLNEEEAENLLEMIKSEMGAINPPTKPTLKSKIFELLTLFLLILFVLFIIIILQLIL